MNETIENTKKYRKKKCVNCTYCYVKYVENGTKSYCEIDDEEVNSNSQPCEVHSFIN